MKPLKRFWNTQFLGGRTPKFLTNFVNLSPSNKWQSLTTTDQATLEISIKKRMKQQQQNITAGSQHSCRTTTVIETKAATVQRDRSCISTTYSVVCGAG